jgi:AAA15 family ATPase/GTPase
MLRNIKFKNFFSFKDEAIVSFVMNKHVPETDFLSQRFDGVNVSKVMAVIGPNASGKTNLIKPLVFISWFIESSFYSKPDKDIPIKTHFFSNNPISEFELEFDFNNSIWKYKLRLTNKRVIHESLYKKTSRLFSYVFERDWIEEKNNYQVKQRDFGLKPSETEKLRENASIISTAAHYGVDLAAALKRHNVFTNVNSGGREHIEFGKILEAADLYANHPELLDIASMLMETWDFGLSRIEIAKQVVAYESGEEEERNIPVCVHSCGEQEAQLPVFLESSGTQGAFLLLSQILPALATGGLAVIDELESDLHPLMIEPIVGLFSDSRTNPQNAQLLFTCHTIEVLNLLNKAQVTLVEKDETCTSQAWRLDSMKGVRNDDNLYAKYMAGAYGAVPNI